MRRHWEWMYQRVVGHSLHNTFVQGVDKFIRFATGVDIRNNPGYLKCPCVRCDFVPYLSTEHVKIHLYKFGFRPGYHVQDYHGETDIGQPNQEVASTSIAVLNNCKLLIWQCHTGPKAGQVIPSL